MSEPTPSGALEFADYYRQGGEFHRLTATPLGRLEFVRTREVLEPRLPASGLVLDVGGGTGIHASWIATPSRRVHVIDPIATHVAAAASLPGVTAVVGDARHLPHADASTAAVLLLGPLYHLTDRADRRQALREAYRVVLPGSLVAAAAVSRYASLLDLAARARLDEDTLASVRATLTSGIHDPQLGFTDAYFHRPDELAAELRDAGFVDVEVIGVEGPATFILHTAQTIGQVDPALIDSAFRLARATAHDPALIAAGSHLIALGRRPEHTATFTEDPADDQSTARHDLLDA